MEAVPRIWSKVLFVKNPSKHIDCLLLAENPKLGLPLIYVTFKSLVLLSYSTIFQAKQLILGFFFKKPTFQCMKTFWYNTQHYRNESLRKMLSIHMPTYFTDWTALILAAFVAHVHIITTRLEHFVTSVVFGWLAQKTCWQSVWKHILVTCPISTLGVEVAQIRGSCLITYIQEHHSFPFS